MRHWEGAELWIQLVLKAHDVKLMRIPGKCNPVDLFTKYLTKDESVRHMQFLGYSLYDREGKELGFKDPTLHGHGDEEAVVRKFRHAIDHARWETVRQR